MKNYWNIKPIRIKPIRVHFPFDTDRDGVQDRYDCRPFDRRRQHISKTMEERIKKLPIVASPTSIQGEQQEMLKNVEEMGNYYKQQGIELSEEELYEQVAKQMYARPHPHIMSKEAKEIAPEARQLFLSSVKKYPGIIGQIEKIKPKKVVITSKKQQDEYMPIGWTSPTGEVYIGPISKGFSKEQKKKSAEIGYHELTHAKQVQEGMTPIQIIKQEEVPYLERPTEQEAILHAHKKMQEYYKGKTPIGKAITKTLELE